jgi:hypothetical protein
MCKVSHVTPSFEPLTFTPRSGRTQVRISTVDHTVTTALSEEDRLHFKATIVAMLGTAMRLEL